MIDDAVINGGMINGAGAAAAPVGPTHPHVTIAVDHCAEAQARLLSQFAGSTDLRELLCIIGERYNGLEQAIADLREYMALDSALGAQLDLVGARLQVPRDGLEDGPYRARIQAVAQVIGSHGRPPELLAALVALDAGFMPAEIWIREDYPAAVSMHVTVPSGENITGETFARIMRRAKPAGVQINLHWEEDGGTFFGFTDDPAASTFAEIGSAYAATWREVA